MTDKDLNREANQIPNALSNESSQNSKAKNYLGALIVVLTFGVLQEPVLQNLQLFLYLPSQFPSMKLGNFIFNIALSCIAAAHLFFEASNFKTKAWWLSFICMAIPYLYLKYVGIYFDHTNYLIADAEGRRIGGGAAFGHLFLGFYVLGAAQLISWLTFSLTAKLSFKNKFKD
jgi:hypothetical protein